MGTETAGGRGRGRGSGAVHLWRGGVWRVLRGRRAVEDAGRGRDCALGHSEIVPRSVVCGKDGAFLAVYVPVTSSQWSVEAAHDAIAHGIPHDQRLAVVSTVQFVRGARQIADMLRADGRTVDCPTIPGLSQGEILGCTAPTFAPGTVDAIVFVLVFSLLSFVVHHSLLANTHQIRGRWTVPSGGSNARQPTHTNVPVRPVHWTLFT